MTLYSEEEVLHEQLRKPVDKILNHNKDFFNSLSSIENVFSYGFSYGEVDMIYITEIDSLIPSDTKWYKHAFPKYGYMELSRQNLKTALSVENS